MTCDSLSNQLSCSVNERELDSFLRSPGLGCAFICRAALITRSLLIVHFRNGNMIFVDGLPLASDSSPGTDTLVALMDHPTLVSSANALKADQGMKFSAHDASQTRRNRWVYVFQREFATVDPSLVQLVGTDEATTCLALIIRNRVTGMTSIAHLDSPKIVDIGIMQMLLHIVDHNLDADLDVHVLGGFDDISHKQVNAPAVSKSRMKLDGYSLPLCKKLIATLGKRKEKFHIRTFFVLQHNTKRDSQGNPCPFFTGLLFETNTGHLIPASFDESTRCPDEIVRRIRVVASNEDSTWDGMLLETYDTRTNRFVVAPCSWTFWQVQIALMLRDCSDEEILRQCSTSPLAEAPDFVDNLRRQWNYLIKHPDWQDTFPGRQPRVFECHGEGTWRRLTGRCEILRILPFRYCRKFF